MKNPHLKLGDTHKAVKHVIRALRRSSMAYYFTDRIKRPAERIKYNGDWIWVYSYRAPDFVRKSRYRHYNYSIKCAVWGFQIREGLPRTGECDAATWAALERFL